DPAVLGEAWRERWLERLDGVDPVIATWLAHQRRDDYWLHGSVGAHPEAITVPLLLIGGWEDGYRDAIVRLLAARPHRTWAVIGPWGHGWPHRALPGPHLDWVAREARWWRHWLNGEDNGVEADLPVEMFVQESRRPGEHLLHRPGRWIVCAGGEVERIRRSFLGHGGTAGVTRQPTQGMHAPVWCPDGDIADFALDQRFEDAVSATIEWPISEDLPILGRPVAHLRVEVDALDAQIAVRLCDVSPDGASTLVAMGASRLAGPGPTAAEVSMRATGYVVPAGHTLRLAVTPGYWPMLWPSASVTTLVIDRDHCTVHVPVVPDAAAVTSIEGAKPDRRHDHRPLGRWVEQTFGSDRVRMHRDTDSGVVELEDGSWWQVGGRTAWSTGDDPLESATTTTALMRRGRGDWVVRWETTSTMTADAEQFHVVVDVAAWEGDDTVFERSYAHDIRRDHG
ncbi:MAG TPA: CocE/NonD family hydrolase C-terminal non-catalytic domain-containing protein, partial [Acidimicrobiales bacterium]|nr:CocE/NonD family hydrolase C-terminal non-catalytic domain-containing protein [Acidimicrobiales bacterium]